MLIGQTRFCVVRAKERRNHVNASRDMLGKVASGRDKGAIDGIFIYLCCSNRRLMVRSV